MTSTAQHRVCSRYSAPWLTGTPEKLWERIALVVIDAPPTMGGTTANATAVGPMKRSVGAPEQAHAPTTAKGPGNPMISLMMMSHHAMNRSSGSKFACQR